MIENMQAGVPSIIFNRATAGSGDPFTIPHNIETVHMQVLGIGGSITALVVDLETSVDGAVSYQKQQTGITLSTVPLRVTTSGLGGRLCRLVSTTFTLNTATSMQVIGAGSKS
jgi:hypothetical protein